MIVCVVCIVFNDQLQLLLYRGLDSIERTTVLVVVNLVVVLVIDTAVYYN